MKIRHVLDANGLHAVYFGEGGPMAYTHPTQQKPAEPIYGIVQPCVHQALVVRPSLEEPYDEVDEIIGFVISKNQIVPADETSEGVSFRWYVNSNHMSEAEWVRYMTVDVPTWGKLYYEQKNPPVVHVPDVVLEEPPTRSRKRR